MPKSALRACDPVNCKLNSLINNRTLRALFQSSADIWDGSRRSALLVFDKLLEGLRTVPLRADKPSK